MNNNRRQVICAAVLFLCLIALIYSYVLGFIPSGLMFEGVGQIPQEWYVEKISFDSQDLPEGVRLSRSSDGERLELSNYRESPMYILGTGYTTSFIQRRTVPGGNVSPPNIGWQLPEGFYPLMKLSSGYVYAWEPVSGDDNEKLSYGWHPNTEMIEDAAEVWAGSGKVLTSSGYISKYEDRNTSGYTRPTDLKVPSPATAEMLLAQEGAVFTLLLEISYDLNEEFVPKPELANRSSARVSNTPYLLSVIVPGLIIGIAIITATACFFPGVFPKTPFHK